MRGVGIEVAGGAGMFALGAEMSGLDIHASVEINERHSTAHKQTMPYCTTINRDMREVSIDSLRRQAGLEKTDIDVVTYSPPPIGLIGGPPCQGLSSMGKRDPEDPRNKLLHEWARFADEADVPYACMENVPDLFAKRNERLLGDVIERLQRANFNIVEPFQVLDARSFGVPQARKRAVIYAYRSGNAAPEYPVPTHSFADDDGSLFYNTPTVADAFVGLPDADEFEELLYRHWVKLQDGPSAPVSAYHAYCLGLSNDPTDYSYRRVWDRSLLTCSQLTQHTPESIARFMATAPGKNERTSRRHRLNPEGYSLTLRAGTGSDKGSFTAVVPIHSKGSRAVTVREAARLQSIPDWVPLSPVKITGFQQIGNSVPPLMAKAIVESIVKAAGIIPQKPDVVINIPRVEHWGNHVHHHSLAA